MTVTDMAVKIAVNLTAASVTPVEEALDSINQAVQHLSLRLADRNSDLCRGSFSRTMIKQSAGLPEDFNGFYGKPCIDDVEIEPLPPHYDSSTAGTPIYYETIDEMFYIYPTPIASVVFTAKYWINPGALTFSSTIPYSGRFDHLLISMATKISIGGSAVVCEPKFVSEVEQFLDTILFPRRPAIPSRRPYNGF